jgi:hypothetical protein
MCQAPRVDWPAVGALVLFAALGWFVTLARGCEGGKPRPAELIAANALR